MATTRYPRLTDLHSTSESGSAGGWVYTTTGDGGAGASSITLDLAHDWEIVSTTPVLNWFMVLHSTNVYVDDINTVDYAIGVNGSGALDCRTTGSVHSLNAYYSPTLTTADAWSFQKIGKQLVMKVRSGGVWRITHLFDQDVTTNLYPSFRTFDTGVVFTPVVTYGQTQAHWLDQTVNIVMDGNSLTVRNDGGGAPSDYFRLKAPVLGSRSTITNVGIDGQNTPQMTTTHTDVDAAWVSGKINILLAWEMTNDIKDNGASAATAATNLGSYFAAVEGTHHWDYRIALTTIPRQNGYADGATLTALNVALVSANGLIVGSPGTYSITDIVDVRQGVFNIASPYFDADFAPASAYFFDASPQRLHLSQLGIDLIVGYIMTTLSGLAIPSYAELPNFTTPPTQQSAASGATATFTSVVDDGSATFQWQSAPITSLYSNVPGTWSNIGGATSANYTTGTLTSADNGKWFRLNATNSGGTTTSEPVRLFITGQAITGKGSADGANGLVGWLYSHNVDRTYRNALFRSRQWPGDTDSAEAAVWGDWFFAASTGGAAALAVAVTSQTTGTAALTTGIPLAASASAQTTGTAALSTSIRLAAAASTVTTATAALTTQVRLASAASTATTLTAVLTTGIPLAASAQVVVTATAAFASSAAALAASVQAQSTATAALSTGIPLAASVASVVAGTAALTTQVRLASSATAQTTATAALTTGIPLAASVQSVTTLTAALPAAAGALSANVVNQATATAALSTGIPLAASAQSVTTGTAGLSTGIRLVASASSQCTATAALTTGIRLAASVQSVVTASAAFTGSAAALQAAVATSTTASAALTTSIRLAAQVIAQAQASAALITGIRLQAAALSVVTVGATFEPVVVAGGRSTQSRGSTLSRPKAPILSRH